MKTELKALIKNAGHASLLGMQEQTILATEKHTNTVLYSKTGSGKTLAFLLSILNHIDVETNGIQSVILAPSRELCLQIETVFRSLKTKKKILTCYGGHSIQSEKNSLTVSPLVLIGTPGRLADHIDRGHLEELEKTPFLVIDEFDKCLEFGFQEDMEFIVEKLSRLEKKLLVSATRIDEFPGFIPMQKAYFIDHLSNDQDIAVAEHLVLYENDIIQTLFSLLCSFSNEKSIVFCNYREVAEDVSNQLNEMGIVTVFYHGGMDQDQRERALIKYRNSSSDILICTDLGARGLDIPEVKHVVHYQYPGSPEAFTHRQGRTARMSNSGNSYLFKGDTTTFPEYIEAPTSIYKMASGWTVPSPTWTTIYFGGGKKDKINKIDLVGFLFKKGGLKKDEIGLITLQDRAAYVAISSNVTRLFMKRIHKEKIKGKRIKIAISR